MRDILDKTFTDSQIRKLAGDIRARYGDLAGYSPEEDISAMDSYRDRVRPFVKDQFPLMKELQDKNAPILVEGANAAMLDLDYGELHFQTRFVKPNWRKG